MLKGRPIFVRADREEHGARGSTRDVLFFLRFREESEKNRIVFGNLSAFKERGVGSLLGSSSFHLFVSEY